MLTRKDLDNAVADVYTAVDKAVKISDETGLSFNLDISYGMGGTYTPKQNIMNYGQFLDAIEQATVTHETAARVLKWLSTLDIPVKIDTRINLNTLNIESYAGYDEDIGWVSSSANC